MRGDPTVPHAVYVAMNDRGIPIYVGVTNSLASRLRQHELVASWWAEMHTLKFLYFENRGSAMSGEAFLIEQFRPEYNRHPGVGRQVPSWRLDEVRRLGGSHDEALDIVAPAPLPEAKPEVKPPPTGPLPEPRWRQNRVPSPPTPPPFAGRVPKHIQRARGRRERGES